MSNEWVENKFCKRFQLDLMGLKEFKTSNRSLINLLIETSTEISIPIEISEKILIETLIKTYSRPQQRLQQDLTLSLNKNSKLNQDHKVQISISRHY